MLALFALAAATAATRPAAAEGCAAPPPYLHLLNHGPIRVEPGWTKDADLQRRLDGAVERLGLQDLAHHGRLGIALVDLSTAGAPRLAAINGTETVYAASIPKIGILVSAFQARKEGLLTIDPALRETLTEMCRVSSNRAATEAANRLGFNYINSVLWQSGLYDPTCGGGLWLGKTYGGKDDYWHCDPVAGKSHAASPIALAKLLTLLYEDKLVDAESSAEMKEILGNPGLHHKFVKGLDARPGSIIYRKSGTWSDYHGDAALVERGSKRYVAVALCETPSGPALLQDLIVALDDCIADPAPAPVHVAGLQPGTVQGDRAAF